MTLLGSCVSLLRHVWAATDPRRPKPLTLQAASMRLYSTEERRRRVRAVPTPRPTKRKDAA